MPSPTSKKIIKPQKERAFEEFFCARKVNRSLNVTRCFPGPAHRLNQKFPNVVLFCFPDRAKVTGPNAPPPTALRFTFVLTNEFGERLFGHSLQLVHGDLICFISRYCWVRFFDEILYRYRMNGELQEPIIAFYNSAVPSSMGTFHSPEFSNAQITLNSSAATNTNKLPSSSTTTNNTSSKSSNSSGYDEEILSKSIAEGLRRPNDSGNAFADVRLCKALDMISNDALLQIIAALICEARVVVVGQRVMDISDAVLALVALLQPFDWQHVLIPVLPNDLLDVLCSPTPFIIGLLAGQIPAAARLPAEDTVVLVLGRNGGEDCYVRRGIPSSVPTLMDTFPNAGSSASSSAAATTTTDNNSSKAESRTAEEIEDQEEMERLYGPVLYLPFTESSLCSLRLGLYQARRSMKHSSETEADQALLAAFHDYFVFTFGLVFASDFTPQTYTVRMTAKAQAESATGLFFERVSNGMMLNELRSRMLENLQTADQAALEMKKRQVHAFVGAFPSSHHHHHHKHDQNVQDDSKNDGKSEGKKEASSKNSSEHKNINSNNVDDDDDEEGPRVFRPSGSDISHIRYLLKSEFLEAVLERYPLLYPHAAQVLAYSNDQEYAENQRLLALNHDFSPYNQTVVNRTVPPLEDASLLRKFASWCSYGFTSTVQKLTTSNKNAIQTRAELEEL